MVRKESSLDRVLGRIDNLDTINLTNLVKKLARERSLLETVFNTALEGILVIDGEGCVEFANAAGMRLIGLKEAELGEATLWRLVPGLRDSLGIGKEGTLKNSMSSRELELTYPEKRFVRLYINPIDHEEGVGVGLDGRRFVVILTDITAEKISREEVIESEKVASVLLLAAGVAHELGNPLNSLTIHLQLMERQLKKLENSPGVDRLSSSIEVCREEVARLDGIIKHFLEAVRPQKPDFQTLDFHEVLLQVLEFQKTELSNRGIRVDVDVCSEPTIVSGDKNQLKQVFFNVVKNAMEAMKPGGTLSIKTRADEELFYMQLGDSGAGIDQENLAKVFQPYHTTKKEGSGLGLMIAQRIMRDHGGQIGIDSREGVGTVVTLEFPRQAPKFRMLES